MHLSKPLRLPFSTQNRSAGFTLAEVALALAIFSFALVSMLGLLSVGLKSSRKANLQTAASNLLSTIVADIQASEVVVAPDESKETYTSPTLKIEAVFTDATKAVTVNPPTLILTDAATEGSAMNPRDQGALKLFKVTLSGSYPNVAAVRVKISWPSNIPEKVNPEGVMESLVPLPVR